MSIQSVMIIDDNEADRYLLSRLVRKAGIAEHIFEASNGAEAIALLARRAEMERVHPGHFPPLLIFLDINMPVANGFEFLEQFSELRTRAGYESVVLMMFSSSEREEERQQALSYDFVHGFIEKMPRSANALKAQVLKVTDFELE